MGKRKGKEGEECRKLRKTNEDAATTVFTDETVVELLQDGMVLLKGCLSQQAQRQVASEAMRLGRTEDRFFACNNELTKNVDMMHLGFHADPATGKVAMKEPIPPQFRTICEKAAELARELSPMPRLHPNVCVVNYYTAKSKLGFHQDVFSRKSKRIPIVSISLGSSAKFVWKNKWKVSSTKSVILTSGDILVFGGDSRSIIHGVERVEGGTTPDYLSQMVSDGRICVTLRQN